VERRLLSLARRAHIPAPVYPDPPRPPKPTPVPQEALATPQETSEDRVEDLLPHQATPKPKAEPPVRVVHRTRKWFDDSERPRFSDMRF
jgi:hypothetical protein